MRPPRAADRLGSSDRAEHVLTTEVISKAALM
jgi:hypothetical protein